MSRYLRYTLLTLLWVAVAAYIVFAASAVRRVRRTGTVGRLEIEVVDSSSQGHLVSAAMVRQWISHAGIKTLGTAVDAVDLTGIERLIARNGFVDKTVAYVSYGGTLHIEISQRKPLVRLLTDGMNAYVTAEGYVFAAPRASSLYVPVVTGSYRPPFPASYVGSVREHIDLRLGEIDERIAELEREKYPSTGVRWRTTATFRPCAACASSGSGGGWKVRGSSMRGSTRCARKKPACAAPTATGRA